MPLAVFTSVTVTLAPVAYVRLWHLLHLAVFISSTVILALDAPGSVHICQDSLWTWHLLHLAVFTSGTRCSWRCSHLLLWLWHLLHLAVFTLVSMTGTRCPCPSPPFTGCALLCSLLQLLMLLTACVVMRVAQRWTNQKVCHSHLT